MTKKQRLVIAGLAIVLAGGIFYFTSYKDSSRTKNIKPINLETTPETNTPRNEGPVSPISGVSCENWNRRPVAVMQPADLQARPAAGFSEADMVIEMPAYTASNTRLMGIYVCNIPEEIGAIRSGRHDNIHLAKGLDAIYVHWGYSIFAENLLNKKIIDNVNCMASSYCDRREATGIMRLEDTGRITKANVLKMFTESGYRKENQFSGYPHQDEAALDQRPSGGNLRVAFAKPYDAEYNYNKEDNSYLRVWGGVDDTDRNNNKRVAPKNVVVMMAKSEQITIDQDYVGKGLQDPWAEVPEIKKTGVESISSRYNNLQIGDPWYDESDSGEAFYYLNGKEYKGTWKKDRSKIDSKLFFYDESGKEMRFVPGQIWVEILEPGQALRWSPAA
jgi:hypothetical protein